MRSTRGAGGKPVVVGGGASVVATVAGAVDGATVVGDGAIIEIGESVTSDVVELARPWHWNRRRQDLEQGLTGRPPR